MLLQHGQRLHRIIRQRCDVFSSDDDDLSRKFKEYRALDGLLEGPAHGHLAVVLQDYHVVFFHAGDDTVRQFLRARQLIWYAFNMANIAGNFRNYVKIHV